MKAEECSTALLGGKRVRFVSKEHIATVTRVGKVEQPRGKGDAIVLVANNSGQRFEIPPGTDIQILT